MKFIRLPLLLATIIVALSPLFLGSTCNNATLDPAGPYQSDTLLWELDGVIAEWTDACVEVLDWADRNSVYVALHANITAAVAKIRAEIDGVPVDSETLERLHDLRDAYVITQTATAVDVRDGMALARTAIETARALIVPQP